MLLCECGQETVDVAASTCCVLLGSVGEERHLSTRWNDCFSHPLCFGACNFTSLNSDYLSMVIIS